MIGLRCALLKLGYFWIEIPVRFFEVAMLVVVIENPAALFSFLFTKICDGS